MRDLYKFLIFFVTYWHIIWASQPNFGTEEEPTTQIYLFPDDVRFAELRCREEFAQNNILLKNLWINREFPDDNATHCFVKCYLRRLGLINLRTRGLDHDKFYQLWENMDLETNENCLGELDLTADLDDLCASYYKKWMHLRKKCADVVKRLFFELGDNYQYPMKYQLPSKALGVSAVEFCETSNSEEKNDAAEVTEAVSERSDQCRLGCIFKRFHYFDVYDRLDVSEILRSFYETPKLTEINTAAIKECVHQANCLYSKADGAYCNMAIELQKCLIHRLGNIFKSVIKYRNNISKQF